MEKFIPYEKLSKKEKRKLDLAKRQTWGELNPVTRKPVNSKAYNRNKARNWKRDYHGSSSSGLFLLSAFHLYHILPKACTDQLPGQQIFHLLQSVFRGLFPLFFCAVMRYTKT